MKTKLPIRLLFGAFTLLNCSAAWSQIQPSTGDERLNSIRAKSNVFDSSINKTAFRSIGPSIMSGRVVDVEVNPANPTEMYVAYATGGLFYSDNNGQSFRPIMDSTLTLFIGDIAVNWKHNRIWVGTGEVNSSRSSYAGVGVLVSDNQGKTWEYRGLPESHHIGKIQLHPFDKDVAWVAVLGHLYSANKERGVYKTTNGGKNWKNTLFISDKAGAIDMEIDPSNPNTIYAATWYRTRTAWNFEESGEGTGIFKSVDGGDTWQSITNGKNGFPIGSGAGRIGIAVSAANPNWIYAIIDNNFRKPACESKKDTAAYQLSLFENISKSAFAQLEDKKLESFLRANRLPSKYTAGTVKEMVANDKIKPTALHEYLFDANTALFDTPIIGAEVYRSEDGGKTWQKRNEKPLGLYNTYGYYFGKIFVSPSNPEKLVITGVSIELSEDGGKTFKDVGKDNVHADHHAVWINPSNDKHWVNGNDGGANITYDNGANWFKANTPSVGQFYAISTDNSKKYNIYGGLQDNGTWFGPYDHVEKTEWLAEGEYGFKFINGGDGMQVQVDTRDNNLVYSGYQFGFYNRWNKTTNERKQVRAIADLGEQPLRYNWQTPILLSSHNQDILYYGANKLYRSFNKGEDLKAISGDLTAGKKQGDVPFGTLATITESPSQFGVLYTGSDDGLVHVTKDGGANWKRIDVADKKIKGSGLPQGFYVSRVVASYHQPGRVYVTLNGYRNDYFAAMVYVSEDYGATWQSIANNLPAEPVNVIREDMTNENILYIGTDGGLYVSLNKGQNWKAWTKGLPLHIPVHDIAIQKRDNDIILGTHGRSLYVADLGQIHQLLK